MDIHRLTEFKDGWICGDFEPSILRTKFFEVGYHNYLKGHKSDGHYHAIMKEINVILKGKVWVDTEVLTDGMIWTVEPNEILETEFLEDTELLIIKSPSVPGDKHYLRDKYRDLWISPEAMQELKSWLPSEDAEQSFKAANG